MSAGYAGLGIHYSDNARSHPPGLADLDQLG